MHFSNIRCTDWKQQPKSFKSFKTLLNTWRKHLNTEARRWRTLKAAFVPKMSLLLWTLYFTFVLVYRHWLLVQIVFSVILTVVFLYLPYCSLVLSSLLSSFSVVRTVALFCRLVLAQCAQMYKQKTKQKSYLPVCKIFPFQKNYSKDDSIDNRRRPVRVTEQ